MMSKIPRFAWGLAVGAVIFCTCLAAMSAGAAGPPNLAKALEAQRRLVAQRPQDAAVWNDLGNLLLLSRQAGEGEAAYRRAIALDPKKASALFNLGRLLQHEGKEGEALQLYRRAIEVEPGFAWAHFQLGTIYERRGDKRRAVHEYSQSFTLDPQLAFREVNPQILDSHLMTESMLRAYRDGSASSSVPQAYDDPTRIAHLMVPPPVASPQPEAADAAKAASEPAPPGQRTNVIRQGDLPAGNAGQVTQPGQGARGAARGAGAYTAPNAYNPYPQNNPQYPNPQYPNPQYPNPQGGVGVGGYGGYAAPTTAPVEGGRQWTRPNPRTDGAQPGAVATPPPGTLYYRPGVASTGQLGTRLGEQNG